MKLRKSIGLLGLPLLMAGTGCGREGPDNVILVVVDTLRADHMGLYGYTRPTTPELDRWAEQGLIFDNALATSSWTLPTFGSVLTGLWPDQHGAGSRLREGSKKWRRGPLSPAVQTLPEILQQHGFTTGAIVNNAFLREHFGAARGFEFYDYRKGRRASAVVELAEDWLVENGQERFFLMVHLIDPHLPYIPPAEFRGQFRPLEEGGIEPRGRKSIVDRLAELTEEDRASLVARYDEEIASVDRQLGRLFDTLEESGLRERTLVILTSDHGEELFDHGGFEHGHSMFQEVLRVPLVFWGPTVRSGRESAPVSVVDLAPTILEATAVDVDETMSGTSLWGLLRRTGPPPRRDLLAQNTLWGRERNTLVSWPYKLILDPKSDRVQLYDLSTDPGERRDLAVEKAAIARDLRQRLADQLDSLEAPVIEPGEDISPEMEEELRALGYLN